MFYVKANREFNGYLRIEQVQGFKNESLVQGESEFLAIIKDIDKNDGEIFGIVSLDVYDILSNAYQMT